MQKTLECVYVLRKTSTSDAPTVVLPPAFLLFLCKHHSASHVFFMCWLGVQIPRSCAPNTRGRLILSPEGRRFRSACVHVSLSIIYSFPHECEDESDIVNMQGLRKLLRLPPADPASYSQAPMHSDQEKSI